MELKSSPGKRYSEAFKKEAVSMYIDTELTIQEISENLGSSESTIWRWIAKFAKENPEETKLMDKIRSNSSNYGPHQPQNKKEAHSLSPTREDSATAQIPSTSLSTEEELRLLKAQLQRERLRADAYEELINVAESKFNIAIRKKAGAKQ